MNIINTVDDNYFELNGVRYAKIYQTIEQGSEAVGVYNIYDTRQQLISSSKFDEYEVDGVVYASQALLVVALLPVVWQSASGGSSGIGEAPIDGNEYLRKNAAWTQFIESGGIEEAPVDGAVYARQDGSWVEIDGDVSVYEDFFSDGLGDNAWGALQESVGCFYNNKTYVSYSGESENPYIVVYDHTLNAWGDAVRMGTNSLPVSDDHGTPSIHVASDGVIHCLFGAHNSAIQYSRSDSSEDISSWTLQTSPCDGTYPQWIEFSNGDLYLFCRYGSAANFSWGYIKSSDGGGTWSSYVEVTNGFAYISFKKGVGDTVHASIIGNDTTAADERFNVYYLFFDGSDWVNASGVAQLLPLSHPTDIADILVLDSGDYITPMSQVNFDSSNNPFIIFPKDTVENGDYFNSVFHTWIARFNGSSWVLVDTGIIGGRREAYISAIDVISSSVIHLYVTEGDVDAGTGTVEKWISTDTAATWAKDETIMTGHVHTPTLITNRIPTARIVFCEFNGDTSYYNNEGYLYGDSGLVKRKVEQVVPTDLLTSLVAVYEFDEASGLIAVDSHNSNDASTIDVIHGETGVYGDIYGFNGSSSVVNAGDLIDFSVEDVFSFATWVKVDVVSSKTILAKYDSAGAARSFLVQSLVDGSSIRLRVIVSDDGTVTSTTAKDYQDGSVDLADGSLHLVGGVFNQGELSLFIDGVDITAGVTKNEDAAITTIFDTAVPFAVGATLNGSNVAAGWITGQIGQTAFWEKALTSDHYVDLYQDGDGKPYNEWQ